MLLEHVMTLFEIDAPNLNLNPGSILDITLSNIERSLIYWNYIENRNLATVNYDNASILCIFLWMYCVFHKIIALYWSVL